MACGFAECMHLDPDLSANDIAGALGCDLFPEKTSLLVEPIYRELLDDSLWLHCKRFAPEGFGRQYYTQDFVQVPSDTPLDEVIVLWDSSKILPPNGCRFWFREVDNLEMGCKADFRFGQESFWLWVNERAYNPPTVKIVEFFAGAFGGWKSATHHLSRRCSNNFDYQTVAVEHDLNAAIAYAIGHASLLTEVSRDMPSDLFSRSNDNWIAWGDVLDHSLLQSLCQWQPHIVTLSPPCQPWSGAGKTKGLSVADGMIFPQTLLLCRWIRPTIILIEEVAGFLTHWHKASVLKLLPWMGYKICWQKVIDMKDHCLSTRNRWLCCAIRLHADLPKKIFVSWPKQSDLHSYSTRLPNLQKDDQLLPTSEAVRIASDPRFLKFSPIRTNHEQTLQSRIFEPGTPLPTFMAMYGRQHCLDEAMFYKSGYLGFFVKDESCPRKFRFWHPAEICFILGASDNVYIDEHYPIAWQHIGNSIGIPHALQLLSHAMQLIGLGDFSPFVVFQTFHSAKLTVEKHLMSNLDKGMILCEEGTVIDDGIMRNVKQLEACKNNVHLPSQVWSPQFGFLSFHQLEIQQEIQHVISQVSQQIPSTPDVSPTLQFQPVLKGFIKLDGFDLTFWHAADLPAHLVEQIWRGRLRVEFCKITTDTTDHEHFMQLVSSNDEQPRSVPQVLQILRDDALSFMFCATDVPLSKVPCCQSLGPNLFDQFGIVPPTCVNSWDLLLLPHPLSCGIAVNELAFTIAAFSQVTIDYQWVSSMDHCCFCIKGESPAPMVVQDALSNALDSPAMALLHRHIITKEISDGFQCVFAPLGHQGIAPEGAFRLGLAIGLTRTLLNQCIVESNCLVRIKWDGRILWQETVHPSTTIGFFLTLLGAGLFPYALGANFHIVNKGQRCLPEQVVASLCKSSHCDAIVLHVVPQVHGGGFGSKNQNRMLQQTALASVLLEHGYDLPWTTKTCDTLLAKFALHRIQAITALPIGAEKLKAIQSICKEADIAIPEVKKPSSRAVSTVAPWSNAKKAKRSQIQLDPKDFSICTGFFLNSDGTPASQLQELRPQATGVVLATTQQAQSWIREGQLISSDELGLLILGKVPETSFSFVEVTFPCKNPNDQMVLLSAKLIQLGTKHIGFLKGPDKKIDSQSCALVAITICKEDWDQDSWHDALHNTQSFLRRVLAQETQNESVLAMWGRSLRSGKAPASPAQALTIQMHATVLDSKLDLLLKQSGFNKLYLTPKLQNGEPNPDFRIMWINGDLPRVTALSAQSAQCLGLVKGRLNQGFGLRFKASDFVDSWKKIFPQCDPPSLPQGNMQYKIEGLPFGCSQQMLVDWADSNQWPVSPHRTLGPQCWLVKTGQAPPKGILMFNSAPLLITPVLPKTTKSEKLITGPLPRQNPKDVHGNLDPWAQWTGPRPSTAAPSVTQTRKVDGPIESRFQAQDEQINSLKAEISKLSVAQEQSLAVTEKRLSSVEQQAKQNASDIKHSMQQIRNDIDQTLKSTIAQQSSMVDDRFKELKDLFLKSSQKRRKPPGEPDDMED